jgi:hypothetical protein
MEFSLASEVDDWESDPAEFVRGVREFIFSTLWMPFFLGVLMGHWYHPWPKWYCIMNRVYRGYDIIPPLILLGVAACGAASPAFFHYARGHTIPSWASFIAVCVGVLSGMLVWPVRVLPPVVRPRGSGRNAVFIGFAVAAVSILAVIMYLL